MTSFPNLYPNSQIFEARVVSTMPSECLRASSRLAIYFVKERTRKMPRGKPSKNFSSITYYIKSVGLDFEYFEKLQSNFSFQLVAPGGNTTFDIMFIGKDLVPLSTHYYIYTSKGILKYDVSIHNFVINIVLS